MPWKYEGDTLLAKRLPRQINATQSSNSEPFGRGVSLKLSSNLSSILNSSIKYFITLSYIFLKNVLCNVLKLEATLVLSWVLQLAMTLESPDRVFSSYSQGT